MKRRILPLTLALTLLLCLLPGQASAADGDTVARCVDAYEAFVQSPPALMYYDRPTEYRGHFLLDFDLDGLPELVLLYNRSMEDCAAAVYYYNQSTGAVAPTAAGFTSSSFNGDGSKSNCVTCQHYGSLGGAIHGKFLKNTDGTTLVYQSDIHPRDSFTHNELVAYQGNGQWKTVSVDGGTAAAAEKLPVLFDVYSIYTTVCTTPYRFFPKPIPTVAPAVTTVSLAGQTVKLPTYLFKDKNGGGTNYVKLRDVAMLLNGTKGQFSVAFSPATGGISLTSGQPYTPVGGELESKGPGRKPYLAGRSDLTLDGGKLTLSSYNIEYNNYFPLRELAGVLGLTVGWQQETGIVTLNPAG